MTGHIKTCLIMGALMMVIGIVGDFEYREQKERELTHTEKEVAAFFIKKGVENPVEKAVVVVQNSKYPKVAAAQAVVESRVKPTAVGKKKERGAFQVTEKHWGRVADRLDLQTRQHSAILEDLLWESHGDLRRAIKAYNGTGVQADQYARLVIRNMREVGL